MTFVTVEGHIFIQIPGGGTTRLDELMNDISEHYSQVVFQKKNPDYKLLRLGAPNAPLPRPSPPLPSPVPDSQPIYL